MAKEKKVEEKISVNASSDKATKIEALEKIRLQCEKDFGKNILIKMDGSNVQSVPTMSSDILGLDNILGGGWAIGRASEIYGPESSGKTTIALHAIAATQKAGNIAALIDAEHAFDPSYAKNLGVDIDNLWLSQPDSGEQALEIAERLVSSNSVSLVVIDSVAALTPQAEIEGDMGDSHMGLQARLMSQALRKLTAIMSKSKTHVMFLNQIRMKIGVMFGNPETTTGGNALKFYASQRLDVRKTETVEGDNDEAVANKIRIKVVKNKIAPPFRKGEFEICFGKGIDRVKDIITIAVEKNVINKAGAWFSYGEEKIGQGMDNTATFLKSNSEMMKEIEEKVRAIIFKAKEPDSIPVKNPKEEKV